MADIPIETLTENCWFKCPNFKVQIDDFIEGGLIAYRMLQCENLKMCKHAVKESKKEEKEWNRESSEDLHAMVESLKKLNNAKDGEA